MVGRLFTIDQMIDDLNYHAVFIATGAGTPTMLNIPGAWLNGVISANEFLTRCNMMRAREFPAVDTPLPLGRRIAVVGAGNAAVDAMRVCLRLGAEQVSCVYRRGRAECGARAEELHHAEQEGIVFHWLSEPQEVLDDGYGNVRGLRCRRTEPGRPISPAARAPFRCPTATTTSWWTRSCSRSVPLPNPVIGQTSAMVLDRRGYVAVDDTLATSLAGVYAGGDNVTGGATVIEAMGAGRRAARSMKAYLGLHEPMPACDPAAPKGPFGLPSGQRNFVRLRTA